MLLPALVYLQAQAQRDFAKRSHKDVWQCLSCSSCVTNRLPKGTSVKAELSVPSHLTQWVNGTDMRLFFFFLPLTHCMTVREALVLKGFTFGTEYRFNYYYSFYLFF